MIDIPKDEKVQVGKAIDYLRKKEFKKNPSFKIEYFIETICSKATYVKLRKIPLKESEIYDSLLAKLNLIYPYDPREQTKLFHTEKLMEDAFIHRDPDEKKLLDSLINYYSTSHSVYDRLKYIAFKDSAMSVPELLAIYEIVQSPIREVIMNRIIDVLESMPPSAMSDYIKSRLHFHTIRNQIDYLFLIIRNKHYYQAVALCESLLRSATLPIDRAKIRIAKLILLHQIDPRHFDLEAQALSNDPSFPLVREDWIHICAFHAYNQNDYDRAQLLFEEEIKNQKTFFPAILFLAHMHDPKIEFSQEVFCRYNIQDYPVEYQHLYTYFKMKFSHSSFSILESYLWNICRKEIKEFYPENIIIRLIHDELEWISENTGNRTKLYMFHQQFD